MFVCCQCCVLSGRGLCDELIIRPEESYRLWCVVMCDLETSRMKRQWHALGRSATERKYIYCIWNFWASRGFSEGVFWMGMVKAEWQRYTPKVLTLKMVH
jgi:hypothetical protein